MQIGAEGRRERENKDIETKAGRHKKTDIHTDRQTERQIDRQIGIHTEIQT